VRSADLGHVPAVEHGLNGNQVDMAAFRKEIDGGAVLMREAIKATEAAK